MLFPFIPLRRMGNLFTFSVSVPHLTSCTPTSQIIWPLPDVTVTMYRVSAFDFPNRKLIFICLCRPKRTRPGIRLFWTNRNFYMFSRWGVVSSSLVPQAGGPPLVGCSRLFIRSNPSCWRSLPPPPRKVRARHGSGDRFPLVIKQWTEIFKLWMTSQLSVTSEEEPQMSHNCDWTISSVSFLPLRSL